MSKTSTINFSDFRWGCLDRRIIMRSGLNYRKNGFLESDNVLFTNNNTVIARPGTRLIKDFGSEPVRIIPFTKNQGSQYIFALQQNHQAVYYIDNNNELVLSATNDTNISKVPNNLTSNTDQDFNISGANGTKNYYQIFSTDGYAGTDINDVTIVFPIAVQVYALELQKGVADGFSVEITKADDTFFEVLATRASSGSNRYEMPSDYDYTNVKKIRIRAYYLQPIQELRCNGGSCRLVTTGYNKVYNTPSAYIQGMQIVGPAAGQTIAEFNEQLDLSFVNGCDWDNTNWYVFFAHQSSVPYYLNTSGVFSFQQANITFPDDYNFESMGNPGLVCCSQSRLWFGNMKYATTVIIGSNIAYQVQTDPSNVASFFNFKPTVIEGQALAPDSAIKFQPIEIKNPISWMVGQKSLGLGSWDGTFKVSYGSGGVISATGAAISQQNTDATAPIKPAFWDGYCVFPGASRTSLRLMDFNLYVDRQLSHNISLFHTELLSRIVKKIVAKKDASNHLYVVFEDGTAAQLCIYSKDDHGYFPFSIANAKILDIVPVKTDSCDRLYITCEYIDPESGAVSYKVVLMDEMEEPVFPTDLVNATETSEEVAAWVRQKCPLDFKQYFQIPVVFLSSAPLYVSQLQTQNPTDVPGILEKYGPYVRFLNDPINGTTWDDLIGKTLFFEDANTQWDFFVRVEKVGDFVFGVPGIRLDAHWGNTILEQDGIKYAVSAPTGFVGIQDIPLAHKAKSVHVFSAREYLGEFDGVNEDGTYKTSIHLEEPVAQVVYGMSYFMFFDIGNVNAIEGMAKRRVSLVNFNTFASWGLAVGTESTSQLVQLFNPKSINGLIPLPMNAWTSVRLEDSYVAEKRVRVQQTLPYPFEIMGLQMVIEENNSETGI